MKRLMVWSRRSLKQRDKQVRPSGLHRERPRVLSEERCCRDAPWRPAEHHEAAPTGWSLPAEEKTPSPGELAAEAQISEGQKSATWLGRSQSRKNER